jgi:hypothetical protein
LESPKAWSASHVHTPDRRPANGGQALVGSNWFALETGERQPQRSGYRRHQPPSRMQRHENTSPSHAVRQMRVFIPDLVPGITGHFGEHACAERGNPKRANDSY